MSQSLEFFNYQNGFLTAEKVNVQKIIQTVGTPVYVYSEDAFLASYEKLRKGLVGLDSMICFAVKSNSNIAILELLGKAGAGMDVVSGGELFRTQRAKVPSNRVVFSGVGKTREEFRMALRAGIYSFNVESVEELFTLNEIALELGTRAPVALRFNPDVDPKTHPYISTGLKNNKFGINKNEILKDVIPQLPELKGIELRGISIHIGSQLLSLSPLRDSFAKLAQLLEKIYFDLKIPLQFVDLGGGLGINYKKEKPPRIEEYCRLIHRYFGRKSKFKGTLKVVLEPGRQLSGNSGVLLTQVLYRKKRRTQDFLIVDAGMNDLIRPALYQSYHEIVPVEKSFLQGAKRKTNVVGPVCESSDFLGKDRQLSQKLDAGDHLAILSAGAYGFSQANQYNSRPRAAEVLIHGGKFTVIRKRESLEDLILGEGREEK